MQIALVTPYFPSPPNTGGRIRIARFASALARQGAVQLFAAVAPEDMTEELHRVGQAIEPYARVVTHPVREADEGSDGPALARRFPPTLGKALAAAHDARPFDVVVVAHSYAGPGVEGLRGTTIVLDEHEVVSEVVQRRLSSRRAGVVRGMLALRRWRQYEQAMWKSVDAITVARAEDAARIHTLRPDAGVVIPNGVDANRYAYVPPSKRGGNTVLFVGDMADQANAEAAGVLAHEVLPRLRELVADASLTIAGRDPSREVRALESDDVRVTGTMTSLAPLYRDHAVFAIPPVPGKTMSLKILEPMSCGMPLVAPPSTLRDLGLEEGVEYLGARSRNELARQLAKVMLDRTSFDAMALAAKRVAERHDWETMGDRFARTVMAAVETKRRLSDGARQPRSI